MSLPPPEIRILSVDDFATMRRIVKASLKKLGYTNVDEAENGVEALAALEAEDYDLVISDWNMPEKSGLELLEEVRAHPELSKLPFLMVTAESERDQVNGALDAGVDDYLLKPFTLELLSDKLAALF